VTISVARKGPLVTSDSVVPAHLSPYLVTTSGLIGAPAGIAAIHTNAGLGCERVTWNVKSSTAFKPSVASAAAILEASRCGSRFATASPLRTALAKNVSLGAES